MGRAVRSLQTGVLDSDVVEHFGICIMGCSNPRYNQHGRYSRISLFRVDHSTMPVKSLRHVVCRDSPAPAPDVCPRECEQPLSSLSPTVRQRIRDFTRRICLTRTVLESMKRRDGNVLRDLTCMSGWELPCRPSLMAWRPFSGWPETVSANNSNDCRSNGPSLVFRSKAGHCMKIGKTPSFSYRVSHGSQRRTAEAS